MVTSVVIPGSELNALNAGCPLFCGANALVLSSSSVIGRWSTITDGFVTDDSDSNLLVSSAYDGRLDTYTAAEGTVATGTSTLYYQIDLGEAGNDVDMVMVHLLNPTSLGSSPTLSIRAADDNQFISDLTTVASWSLGSNRKYMELGLADGTLLAATRRFEGVRYWLLQFTVAGTFSEAPRLSQVVLGRRRQLGHHPITPLPYDPLMSEGRVFYSDSGQRSAYHYHRGRRDFELNFTLTTQGRYSIDEPATLTSLYEDTQFGRYPVIYVPDPSIADPIPVYWCAPPQENNVTQIDWDEYSTRMELRELPPFVSTETYT